MDQLCRFCGQVNFAAILTPRESSKETWDYNTIYRPELTKPCSQNLAQEWYAGKAVRDGPPEDFLPQIRTAYYADLSESEDSEDEEPDETEADINSEGANVSERSRSVRQTTKLFSGAAIGAADSDSEDEVESGRGLEDGIEARGEATSQPDSQESVKSDESNTDLESSIATWSGNSHFTENDRIDLKKQAQGNWNYRPGQHYYLGTIWDVRSRRKECTLCKRFWKSMRDDILVTSCFMTKSRCILKLIDFKTQRKTRDPKSEIKVMQMVFIYGLKLDDPDGYNWICQNPLIIQAKRPPSVCYERPDDDVEFDDQHFGLARDCGTTCNFQLFKRWLKLCEDEHEHPSSRSDFSEFVFRLIDVERECLIYAEDLGDQVPRYVALSYVWGQVEQHCLLMDKIEEMMAPGYFAIENVNLPSTIRDAYDLVRTLGEQYLWIDALCIVQDDAWDKREQIPRMHDIYGGALLTVVAAGAENADEDLAGVESDTRARPEELELDVEGARIVVRDSPSLYGTSQAIGLAEDYLKACESKWITRGWTYQEGMLSHRLLIFHKRQVYWECSRAVWEEQTCWESTELEFQGLRSVKNVTPMDIWTDAFDRRAHDIISPDEEEEEFQVNIAQESYPRLVREYTERQLTSHKDIQSAFQGILEFLSERDSMLFFHGLRHDYFGNDLLFNMTNVLPRRFARVQKQPRRFPIWSWLAWAGQIEIANDARGNSWDAVKNLVPCDGVRCFVLRQYAEEYTVMCINPSGGWKFTPDYIREGEGIWDPTTFHHSEDQENDRQKGQSSDSDPSGSPDNEDRDEEPRDRDATQRVLSSLAITAPGPRNNKKHASKSKAKGKGRASEPAIPVYPQNINWEKIRAHPAFPIMRPNFHVIFATFVSTVLLRTEWDHFNALMSGVVIGGTKRTRGDSLWSNRGESYKRSLYVVNDKPPSDHDESNGPIEHHGDDDEPCPCCGKVEQPFKLPVGKE